MENKFNEFKQDYLWIKDNGKQLCKDYFFYILDKRTNIKDKNIEEAVNIIFNEREICEFIKLSHSVENVINYIKIFSNDDLIERYINIKNDFIIPNYKDVPTYYFFYENVLSYYELINDKLIL